MRVTMSKDGILRGTLRLEVRISLDDIATYLLKNWIREIDYSPGSDESLEDRDLRVTRSIRKTLKEKTNKQILEDVADCIKYDGTETPHYSIGDDGLNDLCDFLKELLSKRFKGFAKDGG